MGIVTTSSATTFSQPAEVVYDFVSNPSNWVKAYPGTRHIGNLPSVPLKIGDTWEEAGANSEAVFTWQLAIAARPRIFVFTSVGLLGHGSDGSGGFEGRMTVSYEFTRPGHDVTLFTRTMTIEAYRDAPFPDEFFRVVNPTKIDAYHAAIARELDKEAASATV
ncbi:SRPBCC family protein [Rhodococcoides yunnanense]|uniref:SRPBCC family protein n=1 Tax=Rhodococcoides yunnanense TaxID=278209 RepID=UPI0009326E9B|nr:SRPBCC family protein [Rhodococcus yunnanensis]